MFIRFVCPVPHPTVPGAEAGMWWAQLKLLDDAQYKAFLRCKTLRMIRRHDRFLETVMEATPWKHLCQPKFALVPRAD